MAGSVRHQLPVLFTSSTTHNVAVGQASETDTTQTLAVRIAVGQASETDTAQVLAGIKLIGLVTETDFAQPVAHGPIVVPIGQAQETDFARHIKTPAAAPVFAAKAAAQSGTASSTVALNHPSGLAHGDLMVAVFADNSANTSALSTEPSGWSIAARQSGTDCVLYWAWKIATNADVAVGVSTWTYSATQTWHSPGISRYTGHSGFTPIDQSSMKTSLTSVGTSHPTNSITTTSRNDLVIGVWVMTSGVNTWTLSGALTSRYNASLQNIVMTMGDATQTIATSVSKTSNSSGGQDSASLILAIEPPFELIGLIDQVDETDLAQVILQPHHALIGKVFEVNVAQALQVNYQRFDIFGVPINSPPNCGAFQDVN